MAESLSGGASVCAVAWRHGLTPPQPFAWRRQARSGSMVNRDRPGCASVVVTAAPIEVELRGAMIRARTGSDAETLRVVLQAVKAVA